MQIQTPYIQRPFNPVGSNAPVVAPNSAEFRNRGVGLPTTRSYGRNGRFSYGRGFGDIVNSLGFPVPNNPFTKGYSAAAAWDGMGCACSGRCGTDGMGDASAAQQADQVWQAYEAYMRRSPDRGGFKYWLSQTVPGAEMQNANMLRAAFQSARDAGMGAWTDSLPTWAQGDIDVNPGEGVTNVPKYLLYGAVAALALGVFGGGKGR